MKFFKLSFRFATRFRVQIHLASIISGKKEIFKRYWLKTNIDRYMYMSKVVRDLLGLIMLDITDLSEDGLSIGMVKSLCKVIFQ